MKKLICLLALVMLVSGCGTTRSKFLFGIGMNGVHNAKDLSLSNFLLMRVGAISITKIQ